MSKTWQLEDAWKTVRASLDVKDVFGAEGAMFLEETGAKCCLRPLAVAMPVLSALAALSNGAAVRLWSDPSPLCIASILVNPPQSRKSQTAALVREIGRVLDEFSEQMAKRASQEAEAASEARVEEEPEKPPSCVQEGFTPEASRFGSRTLPLLM